MSDDHIPFPKPSKKGKAKPKRVNAVTDERAAQKAIYARFVRPVFLAGLARGQNRGRGQAALCERCLSNHHLRVATEVHHIAGRDGWKLTDWTKLRGLCDPCHDWVHSNPEEAYEQGWLERRNDAADSRER